jgi:hypothetical protein
MRNSSLIIWICLDEIPCSIGVNVVWAKIQGYPWWPALKVCRSGMDIAESLITGRSSTVVASATNGIDTDTSAEALTDNNNQDSYTPNEVGLYFYGDSTTAVMSESEALSSIVPYGERSRELRTTMKHVSRSLKIVVAPYLL